MCKLMGNWERVIAKRAIQAIAVISLFSATFCHAQGWTDACLPNNNLTQPTFFLLLIPAVWSPGVDSAVQIYGEFPIGTTGDGGCTDVTISAWTWPNYPDPDDFGGQLATNVSLSGLTAVSLPAGPQPFPPPLGNYTFQATASDSGIIYLKIQSASSPNWFYAAVDIAPPPPPLGPGSGNPPRCPIPTITSVSPDTWIAGQTYPIRITGTGFINAANATPSCPISVITVSVNTGSVTLSDVRIIDSTTITATVKPASTDPEEQAEVILWAPSNDDDDDDIGADDDLTKTANQATPKASFMSGLVPAEYVQVAQQGAKVINLKAEVTDTSNIMNGIVTVNLIGPNGTSGDLNLNLNGKNDTYSQDFSSLLPGSQGLKLIFDSVSPDIYGAADGKWNAQTELVSIPSYMLPKPWTYFRKVFYTQYNTPYENQCTGNPATAWIVDTSCNFTVIDDLKSDFIRAVWLNGSGISIAHGILQNASAVGLGSGSKQKYHCTYPAGAIGAGGLDGNTFEVVPKVTGSCGIPLVGGKSLAMPTSVLSNVKALSCRDQLNLDSGDYTTASTRIAADLCPVCSKKSTFNGADGHIDAFSSAKGCSGRSVGSLGFFYTSYPTGSPN